MRLGFHEALAKGTVGAFISAGYEEAVRGREGAGGQAEVRGVGVLVNEPQRLGKRRGGGKGLGGRGTTASSGGG